MKLASIALVLFVSAFVCPTVFAQETVASSEKEKARQELEQKALSLLNRTAEEAAALKLPENRIYILTLTAELLWSREEKRARQYFQNAASEINEVFASYDERDARTQNVFYTGQNLRHNLLQKLVPLDAELALEILRQTRPPAVRQLAELPVQGRFPADQQALQLARADAQLEQQLAAQVALKNPTRALEIARETLSRGVSHNLLSLIDNLEKLDPEKASVFAEEVAAKIIAADMNSSYDYDTRNVAINFLNRYAPKNPTGNSPNEASKKSVVSNKTLRDVAEKIVASLFDAINNQRISGNYEINNILPAVERLLPERAAALRRKGETLNARNPQQALWDKLNKLSQESTTEQLLAQAENFPPEMQVQLYQTAANKAMQTGDETRAMQILNSLPSKAERERLLRDFENTRYYNAVSKENFDEARKILAEMSDNRMKLQHLINLASNLHGKKQTELAVKLLDEAVLQIPVPAATDEEMHAVLQIARAFATVSPNRAFALLEPIPAQANELLTASATLGKFYKHNGQFRDGELILLSNLYSGFWSYADTQTLRLLAQNDFDRLQNLAENFERVEVRLAAHLLIAQAILTGNSNSQNISPFVRMQINGKGGRLISLH